jgi:hypothetical protein
VSTYLHYKVLYSYPFSLGVLVLLLDCGEGVEAVKDVQHVEAFVLEE